MTEEDDDLSATRYPQHETPWNSSSPYGSDSIDIAAAGLIPRRLVPRRDHSADARADGARLVYPLLSESAVYLALPAHLKGSRWRREASRIIKEFSGGWYGKALQQERQISPDHARNFAHVAFKKLRAELRKRRDADA